MRRWGLAFFDCIGMGRHMHHPDLLQSADFNISYGSIHRTWGVLPFASCYCIHVAHLCTPHCLLGSSGCVCVLFLVHGESAFALHTQTVMLMSTTFLPRTRWHCHASAQHFKLRSDGLSLWHLPFALCKREPVLPVVPMAACAGPTTSPTPCSFLLSSASCGSLFLCCSSADVSSGTRCRP